MIKPNATTNAPIPVAINCALVTLPNIFALAVAITVLSDICLYPSDKSFRPIPNAIAPKAFCSKSPNFSDSTPNKDNAPTTEATEPPKALIAPSAA